MKLDCGEDFFFKKGIASIKEELEKDWPYVDRYIKSMKEINMIYKLKFKDDCTPLNGTEVLCLLQDTVSGKNKIISAFYDDGVYWDSAGSHAEGIEGYMKNTDDTFKYNWVVVGWCLNSFGG